jgi:hypothetical protein
MDHKRLKPCEIRDRPLPGAHFDLLYCTSMKLFKTIFRQ